MSDETLKNYLAIQFGSTVTGITNPNSDIDIGIFYREPLTLSDRATIRSAIAKQFNFHEDKIDLIELSRASPLLQHMACENGKLLKGDPVEFTKYRTSAWKQYLDTAKFRALEARLLREKADAY